MRILHLIYDHPDNPWCGGGGALRAAEVNRRLAAAGNSVTVVHGRFPGARRCRRNGVDYLPIGIAGAYIPSRLSYALSAPWMLARHRADIVVNDVSYFAPVFADCCTRRPVVNVIHHLMGRHALRINPAIGWFSLLSEKAFMAATGHIITPSRAVRDDIAARYPAKRVTSIPNGVAEAYFGFKAKEAPFILFLGRIDLYMKGLDALLEAFAGMAGSDIRLKIAGSGKRGHRRRLEKLVAAGRLEDRVDLLGRVSEAEKRALLRACLFLAMPSRFEGWGITAVEANAAGKPVVATHISGLVEAVGKGAGALMVPPGDAPALQRAMTALVADGDLRREMGRRGRQHARQWSWETVARQQLAFYQKVVAGHTTRHP